jgi:hypothetical protein
MANTGRRCVTDSLDHRTTCDLPTDPEQIENIDCETECPGYATCPFTLTALEPKP